MVKTYYQLPLQSAGRLRELSSHETEKACGGSLETVITDRSSKLLLTASPIIGQMNLFGLVALPAMPAVPAAPSMAACFESPWDETSLRLRVRGPLGPAARGAPVQAA